MRDYGTVSPTRTGAMTMPIQAREQIGLPLDAPWRVFGSVSLELVVVVGPRRDPKDSLEFLLRETPD